MPLTPIRASIHATKEIIFACRFIGLSFENKKRRATIRCLFSELGYRQVTINANKQEQFTPIYGREPSELLALALEYFAGILFRERQEQKAQVI